MRNRKNKKTTGTSITSAVNARLKTILVEPILERDFGILEHVLHHAIITALKRGDDAVFLIQDSGVFDSKLIEGRPVFPVVLNLQQQFRAELVKCLRELPLDDAIDAACHQIALRYESAGALEAQMVITAARIRHVVGAGKETVAERILDICLKYLPLFYGDRGAAICHLLASAEFTSLLDWATDYAVQELSTRGDIRMPSDETIFRHTAGVMIGTHYSPTGLSKMMALVLAVYTPIRFTVEEN